MPRIVIHADDVGFCQGSTDAFIELATSGGVSSGSVMVPCPWFPDLATRLAPLTVDVGVHLTLTSEHDGYRWGPLTRPSSAAGLTDADGYLWPAVADVRRHAHPEAVEAEWRAQIERAQAAGIEISHLDAHMGAALAPEWCDRYVALGVELGIPALITRSVAAYGPNKHLAAGPGLVGATEDDFATAVAQAEMAGLPVFDLVIETDFRRQRGSSVDYRAALTDGVDGHQLVFCAFHPCAPGPGEVERIDPEWWHVRTDEYSVFADPAWMAWLDEQPFEVVSMAEL